MPKTYSGGCQCGNVRYEVQLDLNGVMACNCSRCGRLGSLLAFAPAESFTLLKGEDALTEYTFNKHAIHHLFCKTCGIQSFSRGTAPDGRKMAAINVRCLDDVDIDALPVQKIDGRSY
jgi:hypothetical protein